MAKNQFGSSLVVNIYHRRLGGQAIVKRTDLTEFGNKQN